jgi:hypothetical protein
MAQNPRQPPAPARDLHFSLPDPDFDPPGPRQNPQKDPPSGPYFGLKTAKNRSKIGFLGSKKRVKKQA